MARSSSDDGALFDVPADKDGPGPVYQGVGRTIRALAARQGGAGSSERETWRQENGAAISAALSLGASIDRVSGHRPGARQAAGMQLSALHAQLLAWLERLDPHAGVLEGGSVMDDLTRAFQEEEERQRAERARATSAPSHREE